MADSEDSELKRLKISLEQALEEAKKRADERDRALEEANKSSGEIRSISIEHLFETGSE